ncbi:MAG: hypothetical protein D6705_05345 [Deltaproteobacteria bacterium]|nr:MAG: hypothetical protein D6705_05345 [Deltaproteobacteria bacterium]
MDDQLAELAVSFRGDGEARRAMAAAMTAFRRAYRAASRRFREGVRNLVFPAGTWLYRVRYQACCETAAPP